jgi:superoxide reductase
MARMVANTVDASKEKHVPVVERTAGGIKVRIGSVPHPMEEKHYIEFIEVIADGKVMRKYLRPGMPAEAEFAVSPGQLCIREYCNLHGLWMLDSV